MIGCDMQENQNKGGYVAIIGGANVDIHGKSDEPLRLHDSNPGELSIKAGGVATNIARSLTNLGIEARLISVVGDDHFGDWLLDQIGSETVHRISGAATSTYLTLIDADGEMHAGISAMEISDHLTPDLLRQHEDLLRESLLIVVDANLPESSLVWITENFADKPIFADTVSVAKAPRLKACLDAIHTLKTNAIELRALTDANASLEEQLAAVDARNVFVTLGREGVLYSSGGQRGHKLLCEPNPEIRNTTGAGDAFLAGLVYSELNDMNLEDSLEFALHQAQQATTDD